MVIKSTVFCFVDVLPPIKTPRIELEPANDFLACVKSPKSVPLPVEWFTHATTYQISQMYNVFMENKENKETKDQFTIKNNYMCILQN